MLSSTMKRISVIVILLAVASEGHAYSGTVKNSSILIEPRTRIRFCCRRHAAPADPDGEAAVDAGLGNIIQLGRVGAGAESIIM